MPAVKRSSPSLDIMPNVVKVLDLILAGVKSKNSKKWHDIHSQIAAETIQPQYAKTIGKQCVGLTNSALCGHRYSEAVKLLWVLCQDRSVFDMFIFRASMIVLENFEMGNRNQVIHDFLKDIQYLELVNKKEVQLEHIIRGLSHISVADRRSVEDVKVELQVLINMKRKNYLRKNSLLDPIFEGYVMYLDWVQLCDSLSKGKFQGTKDALDSVIEDAILKCNTLLDNPGNWDVFVLKLVELLERCGKQKEAKNLLVKYAESHPDNLNAHIYLSLHLYETEANPDSEKLLIYHLEKISEMSPSDERVLILLEKLEKLDKKLEKCFMFLDYPSNEKNQKAWNMLSSFLQEAEISNNRNALNTIKILWTSRQKSWHWLYFNPTQVPQLEETGLVATKVKVLSYLDKDHEFVKEVIEKFPTLQVIT